MSGNLAQSIHQRLLNKSSASGRMFSELLQQFVLERFLYRLGQSQYRDRFVLKGALMLIVWHETAPRFTRDIDLLGFTANDLDAVANAMREICDVEAPADGVEFDRDSVSAARIVADGIYQGVRVTFLGFLGTARLRMQVDIGFGDPVVPKPTTIAYPVLLDLPPPVLLTYSRESAIAEKLAAMLRLGRDNSRMKDYYDIWLLSRHGDFDGATLTEAVRQACAVRSLEVVEESAGLSPEFALAEGKAAQWQGFVRKTHAATAPADLGEVVLALRGFLGPVLMALSAGEPFTAAWRAPGPWRPK